jgi:hypothetical protein
MRPRTLDVRSERTADLSADRAVAVGGEPGNLGGDRRWHLRRDRNEMFRCSRYSSHTL